MYVEKWREEYYHNYEPSISLEIIQLCIYIIITVVLIIIDSYIILIIIVVIKFVIIYIYTLQV